MADEIIDQQLEQTISVEKNQNKESGIIDFFISIPQEDNKRIVAYLEEHPEIKITAEELPSLNKFLKETNYQSIQEKANFSREQELASCKTPEEREAWAIKHDLWRDPRFGSGTSGKISPAEEVPAPDRGYGAFERDQQWEAERKEFEEFKKENPQLGL